MTAAEHMRAWLIAEGILRDPRVAAPPADPDEVELPPCWVDPQEGLPAPGEAGPEGSATERGRDVVVGLFSVSGIAPAPMEEFMRVEGVDLRFRSTFQYQAVTVEKAIRVALNGQQQLDMAGWLVQHARMFTPWQPYGSDREGYDSHASYLLWTFEDDYLPDQG